MNDQAVDAMRRVIPQWYASRRWAEELLVRALVLETPQDVLRFRPKNVERRIPGSNWWFRTHGTGVDVRHESDSGGIDFDFDKPAPDPWRLMVFARRQIEAGNVDAVHLSCILDDEDRLTRVAAAALAGGTLAPPTKFDVKDDY